MDAAAAGVASRQGRRFRDDGLGRTEVDQRLVGAGTFEGEFSDAARSYGGKGVVRYAW